MSVPPILTPGSTLLVATHNQGKAAEFARRFGTMGIAVVSGADRGLPEPEETGTTFVANARLKASAAALASGLAALADDSGLSVDALDGAPGLYSARWAREAGSHQGAFDRLVRELGGIGSANGATAAFVCALSLVLPDGQIVEAEGRVEGTLHFPARGEGGFGYDPIFVPDGETRTFGEMTPSEKHAWSHRDRAIDALLARLGADA